MKKAAKSAASVASELERVRARLAEVESTLEAIRSGEVDAMVVNDRAEPRFSRWRRLINPTG